VKRIARLSGVVLTALVLLAPCAAASQGPAPTPIPRGELQPFGTLQTILSTTTAEDAPTTALDIRRARVGLSGRYGEALSARVQLDLVTGSPTVVDAYVDVAPARGTRIRAGRAFRPFGLLTRTSSSVILPIERGLRIRGVTGREHQNLLTILEHAGREVGVQGSTTFSGPGSPGVQAGVFFPQRTDGSRFLTQPDLSARASLAPTAELTLGASASHGPVNVAIERESAVAMALDAALERGGLRVMAELSGGNGAPLWEDDFVAGQVWAGYRFPFGRAGVRGIEPTARVSHAAIEGAEAGTLLTPGVTFYLGGRDRLMFNYDHWRPAMAEASSHGAAKISLQLIF
jgi:hypothetical protein